MDPEKNNDSKESNTANEVNIATEVIEFKEILFNKKVVRHKMKRIKSKKKKLVHMKSIKHDYHVLMIKDLF